MQNGLFDTKSTGGLEYATVTNEDGAFALNSAIEDSSVISVVVPYGYELDPTSPNQLPLTIESRDETVYVEFYLRKINE